MDTKQKNESYDLLGILNEILKSKSYAEIAATINVLVAQGHVYLSIGWHFGWNVSLFYQLKMLLVSSPAHLTYTSILIRITDLDGTPPRKKHQWYTHVLCINQCRSQSK